MEQEENIRMARLALEASHTGDANKAYQSISLSIY
jgi:hypothetical protein